MKRQDGDLTIRTAWVTVASPCCSPAALDRRRNRRRERLRFVLVRFNNGDCSVGTSSLGDVCGGADDTVGSGESMGR